jgi:chromate transporter
MIGLWNLFWTFSKVGVMTFGGGYAMLPILQREIVENRNWATEEELANYFAIGQCTPGIIAVNTATFIGQKQRGAIGGILATLGVVFPSIVIISILAGLITNFANIQAVQNAFAGIRVCVCILIFNAICKLWKGAISGCLTFIIFLAVALLSVFLKVSPTILVVIAAVVGIALELVRKPHKGEGDSQ